MSCYAGYSRRGDQRANGASGGLATWFLTELLRRGVVSHVACVQARPGSKPLFEYTICDTLEQVESGAKSAYYPVEASGVLERILSGEGRYAVVCLPCVAKSLRLAGRRLPCLAERLVCVVGLVCGHGANAYFAEYAAALADPEAGPPSRVTFRTKNPRLPATEHGIECSWRGADNKTVYWSQGLGRAWSGYWFTPIPCLYCDDVFAETADVAFMDAWLPRYMPDYRGTNLVVTRSQLAEDILRSADRSSDIHLEPCSAEDLARSQATALCEKRDALSYRLCLAGQQGRRVPQKRVPDSPTGSALQRLLWRSRMRAAQIGPGEWLKRDSLRSFVRRMPRTASVLPLVRLLRKMVRRLIQLSRR